MTVIYILTSSVREKEARQPRFPMEICERTFTILKEYLHANGYTGPIGLACDDTKLFSVLRLYWDSEQQAHFLVGGTDGPVRVANPDQVKRVIESAKITKAVKVGRFSILDPPAL
jgi:hypothetical protein